MDNSNIPDKYRILASRWKDGSITPAEAKEFADWYNKDQDRKVLIPSNFARDLEGLETTMFQVILEHTQPVRKVTLWPRIAVAIAVAIVIFGAGLFYFSKDTKPLDVDQMAYQNDIAPGKMGATLTLANGKKISLTDHLTGKLAEEAGVSISKTNDGKLIYKVEAGHNPANQVNTVSTAPGETYVISLADGTSVWLNAASSLTFNTQLNADGERKVKLSGEGYFEVAKDKSHPFIVETASQKVEVLGTHFNINSYPDEPIIKTTLLEGSVKVNVKNGPYRMLKPGQQALLSDNKLNVKPVDINSAIDWKNSEFTFNNETLESILRKVARWYDVEIVYEGNNKSKLFWGSVSRYEHLNQVLQTLELTGDVKFRLTGRRLYVNN
jgi:transmembrane sensor